MPTVGVNETKLAFRNVPTFSSIQELSFQTVIDTILKPAGVKVGGFPQEMFIDLTEDEQQKWACNIWSVVSQNGIDQTILYVACEQSSIMYKPMACSSVWLIRNICLYVLPRNGL